MITPPLHVIPQTYSELARLAMWRTELEINKLINAGPGETFYDSTVCVRLPEGFTDNDVYAIIAMVEHAGWAKVNVCGGVLYFNFPPVKGV